MSANRFQRKYDMETNVAIVGAGPAGASTSIFLAKKGIKHIIFDKEDFPRDKICGDGLSGKVVSVLEDMNPALLHKLYAKPDTFLGSWGVYFAAPNGRGVNIPFRLNGRPVEQPPGFVARRIDFDHFLVQNIDNRMANPRFNCEIVSIERRPEGVVLTFRQEGEIKTVLAQMVVGAGGDRCPVNKTLTSYKLAPDHYYAGLRAYYKNVSGMQDGNFIELHFLDEVLPGYFWIFPLPNNMANVGIGMLSRDIRRKRVNLREIMLKAIKENPTIRHRFKQAEEVDGVKGWGLPLASQKRPLSGERFVLVGDAGSLIDPFTGEGIGNAMFSAQIAADVIARAVEHNDYSAALLKEYDRLLYDRLWDEIHLSYRIQRLVQHRWLFNFVINRLNSNKKLMDTFSLMFNDLDMREKLKSPLFYLRLLFNR